MKFLAFFLGPQHAQISIGTVVLFTGAMILHAFGFFHRDHIYEFSKLIGLMYGASILISLLYRPQRR